MYIHKKNLVLGYQLVRYAMVCGGGARTYTHKPIAHKTIAHKTIAHEPIAHKTIAHTSSNICIFKKGWGLS